MRYFLVFVLSAGAFAQTLSMGLKVGVPVTDAFHAASVGNISYIGETRRFVIGPTVELHLPFGFSAEVDALYRNQRFRSSLQASSATLTASTSSGAWEFPVLAKYRMLAGPVRPFVLGGLSFNRLTGVKQDFSCTGSGCTPGTTGSTGTPGELEHRSSVGIVLGAGLELNVLVVKLSPEIRYTGWTLPNFSASTGGLKSVQNQAEFLVGINF